MAAFVMNCVVPYCFVVMRCAVLFCCDALLFVCVCIWKAQFDCMEHQINAYLLVRINIYVLPCG